MALLSNASADVKALLALSQDEARALGHGYIGTEHLLIALLADPTTAGVRAAIAQGADPAEARRHAEEEFARTESPSRFVSDEETLAAVGIDLQAVRQKAESEFGVGALAMRVGAPAFTPRAKSALEHAVEAAESLQRTVVEPDHILLGILADQESVAYRALSSMCGDLHAIRTAARGGP